MDANGQEYQADMTYAGADFRRYLADFKEFFDIAMDSEATDQIAQIMRLILPVHRMDDIDASGLVFRPPVARVVEEDELEEQGDWGGDVVRL